MRARIVKINDRTIVIKGNNGKFATISKTKIQFKYKLGDFIAVEKDGDKLYFLPDVEEKEAKTETPKGHIDDSFLDDVPEPKSSASKIPESPQSQSLVAAIISLSLAFVAWFIAFIPCLVGGIVAITYAFTKLKDAGDKRDVTIILLVIGIIAWVAELVILVTGYAV